MRHLVQVFQNQHSVGIRETVGGNLLQGDQQA
jgi:hypothetical protein